MDDNKNIGSPDKDKINVNEKYELEYWSKELGVTTDELRKAVKTAATSVKDIRAQLKK